MRKAAEGFGRTFRPTRLRKSVRRIYPHWKIDWVLDPKGNLESRGIDNHFIVDFASGATTEVGVNMFRELLVQPFVINRRRNIAIAPGLYTFHEALWHGSTNTSRRMFVDWNVKAGPFYSGYARNYTVGGTVRLNYQFSTRVSYTHSNIDLREGSFDTGLLTLRADYSFSTKAFLNALIQYNRDTQQWTSNIRFNLIHRPLSDLFLVYDERRLSPSTNEVNRAVIAKLTYMLVR